MLTSKHKQLSPAGLRQLLDKALDKCWVKEQPHSEMDRSYRNISDDDIEHGLKLKGWIIEKTEPAKEAGLFKYTIRTAEFS